MLLAPGSVEAAKQRINCCVMLWSTLRYFEIHRLSSHAYLSALIPLSPPLSPRQTSIPSLILAALIARALCNLPPPASIFPFLSIFFFSSISIDGVVFFLPSPNVFFPCMHLLIICAFYSAGKLFSKRTWNYLFLLFKIFPKINRLDCAVGVRNFHKSRYIVWFIVSYLILRSYHGTE